MTDYNRSWKKWNNMIDYSPAPRHRRRIIRKLAEKISFNSLLDIGCGNGMLLSEFQENSRAGAAVKMAGIDVSGDVINADKQRYHGAEFHVCDIGKEPLPLSYDLVVCSEVIEHLDDPARALANIARMNSGCLILTVPGCRLYPIDKLVGHKRHFDKPSITKLVEDAGYTIEHYMEWGFPFHSLYKFLINLFPRYFNEEFAEKDYNPLKLAFSRFLYYLFFLNLNLLGQQIILVARRRR
jgi:SAM-dependent methyltransferase